MIRDIESLRRPHQSCGDLKIRCRGVLDRSIFAACAVHAHCRRRNYNVTALHIRLHTTACTDPYKRMRAAPDKFLEGDGCGRTADAGRRD